MGEKKTQVLPWVIVGFLVLVLIGGGIYIYFDMNRSNSKQTQAAGSQTRTANQNPALRAAMSLQRLEQKPDLALSAEQKAKLIPVLQDLINTQNPSQDFLQQKADLITGALTQAQKDSLNSQRNGAGQGNPSGSGDGTGRGNWNGQAAGNGQGAGSGQGQGQNRMQPQDLYKRVLDSLK